MTEGAIRFPFLAVPPPTKFGRYSTVLYEFINEVYVPDLTEEMLYAPCYGTLRQHCSFVVTDLRITFPLSKQQPFDSQSPHIR